MKSFALATALVASLAYAVTPAADIDLAQFTESTFTNLVDHFNFLDSTTYEQRYWVSDQYWDGSGPIFIYICGEYRCSVNTDRLYPWMLGADHKARFMVLEHRFYGDSQPMPNWELSNLKTLNSQQALADLAVFIGEMNPDQANEVLVIGGSYPGAMAAWFRERYPHLTIGAWSSSGVVNPIIDFWQFDEQTYTSSAKSGATCPQMIQDSMTYVTAQGVLRDSGTTPTPTNIIDTTLAGTAYTSMLTADWMFYYADIFVESVQYGHRTEMCQTLMDNVSADSDTIVTVMTQYGATIGVTPGDYDTSITAETTIDVNSSARPWTFQYCSQYGWFQVPSEDHVMRSTDLAMSYWTDMCARVFGTGMVTSPKVTQTAIGQGALDIAQGNIFFANGVEDPWQWATQTTSNTALNQVARMSDCDDCGHCVEMYTPTDSDPTELVETRQMLATWIDELLSATPTSQEILQ